MPRIQWRQADGQLIACKEKIKMLQENLDEFNVMMRDLFDDALIMGCDEQQIRDILHQAIDQLSNPYQNQ
ncbi:MAG: hypothetical protein K1X44_02185 [Alphaproteobacteria bacterium]|nr:hypothetical protein [Alphaproteobacteria bacterium]